MKTSKTELLKELETVYHKDYGFPHEMRLHIVFDSMLYGIKAAAKKNRVSEVSIYKWRKDYASVLLEGLT